MKNNYLLLVPLIFQLACAQFIPPTGGPKDEEPPLLVNSVPINETRSYKATTLYLEFNELINATTLRQELIVTPDPGSGYDLKIKPYGVELKYDKPFLDSTTYSFNFRNGIKDLNENNPAQNLKLVFSTGPEIDSLSIVGKVKNLWTGRPAEEVLIGLYDLNTQDTLPLLERKPKYFHKTDTSGKYTFENIKSSSYRILGFTDPNLNLIYNSSNELFGFLQDTINLKVNYENQDFNIYENETLPPKIRRSVSRQENFSVSFNKNIKSVNVEYLKRADTLTYALLEKELVFFNYPKSNDTTLTKIIVKDSIDNILIDTLKIYFRPASSNKKSNKEKLLIHLKGIKKNVKIKKPSNYLLYFDYPIVSIDTSKIIIRSDTIKNEFFELLWKDKSHTKLDISFNSQAKELLELTIEEGAITNYKSDSNDTYQLINKLYQQPDFGSIDGSYDKFNGSKIVHLLNASSYQIIDSQEFTSNYNFQQVLPGSYRIRIIEDANSNGRWDTANFKENQLPERIIVSKGTIKLKANFQLSGLLID